MYENLEVIEEYPQTSKTSKSFITYKHYQDAIEAQNACNLSGLVFSFAKAMEDVCKEANRLGQGTDWKNNHCLVRFWLHTLSALSGNYSQIEEDSYAEVYKLAQGN